MRLFFAVCLLFGLSVLVGCAPITIDKCYEEYKYDSNGRMTSKYNECIHQIPEKMAPIHLKQTEMYQ